MKTFLITSAGLLFVAAIIAFAFFPDSETKWLLVAFFWIALFNIRREAIAEREENPGAQNYTGPEMRD